MVALIGVKLCMMVHISPSSLLGIVPQGIPQIQNFGPKFLLFDCIYVNWLVTALHVNYSVISTQRELSGDGSRSRGISSPPPGESIISYPLQMGEMVLRIVSTALPQRPVWQVCLADALV